MSRVLDGDRFDEEGRPSPSYLGVPSLSTSMGLDASAVYIHVDS